HQSHAGRDEHIVLLASANKSGIRGPEKGRVNGNRERFIFFHPLQDLLLADVFIARTRDRVALSFGTGRGAGPWISLSAEQFRAALSRAGPGLSARGLN